MHLFNVLEQSWQRDRSDYSVVEALGDPHLNVIDSCTSDKDSLL